MPNTMSIAYADGDFSVIHYVSNVPIGGNFCRYGGDHYFVIDNYHAQHQSIIWSC